METVTWILIAEQKKSWIKVFTKYIDRNHRYTGYNKVCYKFNMLFDGHFSCGTGEI